MCVFYSSSCLHFSIVFYHPQTQIDPKSEHLTDQ